MFSRSKEGPSRPTSSGSNQIAFNVGGQRFEISPSLINSYPNSHLASLFHKASTSTNKELFLDHNPAAFSVVLDYLRYGGQILIPRNVCTEVVILQLKAFGLPVPEKIAPSNDEPPAYSASYGEKSSLSQTVSQVMESKVVTLVENYIRPLILEHARSGHPKFEIYLLDEKIKQEDVADTISDDVPVEWIFLTDKSLRFGDSGSTSLKHDDGNDVHDRLMHMIKDLDGISLIQREKLVSVIAKSKEVRSTNKSELPDVSYLIKTGVLPRLEEAVRRASSVKKCLAERRDLTVRNENEFGLLESTNIHCVRMLLDII